MKLFCIPCIPLSSSCIVYLRSNIHSYPEPLGCVALTEQGSYEVISTFGRISIPGTFVTWGVAARAIHQYIKGYSFPGTPTILSPNNSITGPYQGLSVGDVVNVGPLVGMIKAIVLDDDENPFRIMINNSWMAAYSRTEISP